MDEQRPKRSSSWGQTMSRTVSSLFPALFPHYNLSDEDIYATITAEEANTETESEKQEEFFEAISGESASSPEDFYDALDVPSEELDASNNLKPTELLVEEKPVAVKLNSDTQDQSKRCSFIEFLQEDSAPMDLLTALQSDQNLTQDQDYKVDMKEALRSTSTISEQVSIQSALRSQHQSSLSELRSALGSSVSVEEETFRRSLFAPPPDHRKKESFLKRNIPLAGFFADSSEHEDKSETDSMLSTLTDALTLRSNDHSANVARLSRKASILIPFSTEANPLEEERKLKASRRYKPVIVKVKSKTKAEFNHLHLIQELNRATPLAEQIGSASSLSETVDASRAIFALKFSPDGNYLAAAGAEGEIRIWRLLAQTILDRNAAEAGSTDPSAHLTCLEALKVATIFEEEPVQVLHGHSGEILDLAWSSNNFLLSACMDKTVRLWHYSRADCLGIFEHLDYVTSIAFHPRDPRLFVSGSLDCKLRLWSIQEKAIQSWNELPPGNFITAVTFTRTGKSVIAGTAGGIALIFETEGLRYHTQVHVRSSKSKTGKKITGIESVPGNFGDERIVVSSNDSRIRMYSLRDKNVLYKYKGHENDTSQIRASLSTDGDYVLSGSEDCRIFLWNADGRFQKKGFFSSFRKDHVLSYESFKAHSNPVTAAVLAPSSVQNLLKSVQLRPLDSLQSDGPAQGQIIVTADITGQIKVFENNSRLQEWLS